MEIPNSKGRAEGYIFGSGAQGRVALDILRLQYPKIRWSFIDDNSETWNKVINGAVVKGGFKILKGKSKIRLHVALGNPSLKEAITKKCVDLKIDLVSAIHPSAVILPTAKIGKGVTIGAGAVVNTDAVIGNGVMINTNAVIEHDTEVGDFSNISPMACVGGRVKIANGVFVGSGALVIARASIGSNSIIGMGAVVTRNIPENTLAYGVPAKAMKKIDEKFDWRTIL